MIDQPQNFFLAQNEKECSELSKELRTGNIECVGRSTDKSVILLTSEKSKENDGIVFKYRGKNKIKFKQELTITFNSNKDKYFFKASFSPYGSDLIVREKINFYRLMRRSDYRLSVPLYYEADFIIKYHKSPLNIKAKIRDVSATGCQLNIQNVGRDFFSGDHIRGIIKFHKRPDIEVSCLVRHSKRVEKNGYSYRVLGIRFDPTDKELEKKMRTVVLDLYRELFSSFSKKFNE